MANRVPKSFQQLANDAAKGIIHSTVPLRTIANSSELNQLKLLDEQIDSLMAIIQSPDIDTGYSEQENIKLEIGAAASEEFEGGYLVGKDTTYSQLKKYIDVLNKDKPEDDKYHLGHETGVYTYYLQILRDQYKPDISGKTETGKAIVRRQKALLDNALRASIIIDSLDAKAIAELRSKGLSSVNKINAEDLKLVLESAGFGINLDIEVKKDFTKLLTRGHAQITLVAESESNNKTTGNLSRVLSTMVKASFASGKTKGNPIDDLLSQIDPFELTGSPTEKVLLGRNLVAKGKGKKTKSSNTKKYSAEAKIRASNQTNIRLKRRIRKRLQTLQTYAKAKRQKKKFIIPTVSLKALINESLAEHIRLRMGDPNDRPFKLRNQTGRFSESAYLLTLNRTETGHLIGTYDFQKRPYGVFLPGGRLHTQQRDPKLYIEGAIRDIAAKVLKRQFKGIALELK